MNSARMQFISRPGQQKNVSGRAAFLPLLKVMAGFVIVGSVLFLHVWLPIQAERSLLILRRIEGQISQKKAELNNLNDRYASMTSLTALDNWAKKNGPWVPTQSNNVITIEK